MISKLSFSARKLSFFPKMHLFELTKQILLLFIVPTGHCFKFPLYKYLYIESFFLSSIHDFLSFI